jgi:hypothetical protein
MRDPPDATIMTVFAVDIKDLVRSLPTIPMSGAIL